MRKDLEQFLTLQSVVDADLALKAWEWMSDVVASAQAHPTPAALKDAMCASLEAGIRRTDAGQLALPLSIGFDSRFILGCLREVTDLRNVDIFTMGQPGNYEYDFAPVLYRGVVSHHRRIDFTDYSWDTASLVALLRQHGQPAAWNWPPVLADLSNPVVHGYLGDSLAGGRLPRRPSPDVSAMLTYFEQLCRTNASRRSGLSAHLAADFQHRLADRVSGNPNADLLADFALRQEQRIRPRFLEQTHGTIYPFMDPAVIAVFASTTPDQRAGERWYMAAIRRCFPDLFRDLRYLRIHDKYRYNRIRAIAFRADAARHRALGGRRAWSALMYDWRAELTRNRSLIACVREHLADLRRRDPEWPWDLGDMERALKAGDEHFLEAKWQEIQLSFYAELNMKAGVLAPLN